MSARRFRQVAARGLNLRAGPGTECRVLRVLPEGAPLEMIRVAGDWVMVRASDLADGWVAARYLRPHPVPWLAVARQEEARGVAEIPGPRHSQRILTYHASTSLHATEDEIPWCSAFACWVLEQCGIRSTRSAAARSWLSWGQPLAQPREGCLAVFRRTGNPNNGHVALYLGDLGSTIRVLGGNQGDRVCEATYPMERLLGFRWPLDWRPA